MVYAEKQNQPLDPEAVVSLLLDTNVISLSMLLGQVVDQDQVAFGELIIGVLYQKIVYYEKCMTDTQSSF